MSIKFHLNLGMALSMVVGMFVMCGLYFFLKVGLLLSFLSGAVISYVPRLLFCYLFHALCPKCGGTARQQSGALRGEDIRYACNNCGYTQQTEAAYMSDSPDCF